MPVGILANALESAYKKDPDHWEYSWVTIDPGSFEITVFAQELDEEGDPFGDEFDVTPENFGRIAAQTTKQILLQGIREEEREMKYEEYAGREGDIVTGIVQQTDARYTLLDLGRVDALLPQSEQVSTGPRPKAGDRHKAYIVEVRKTDRGPQIVVSRTHPGLVKRLFELEVPEIADGIVELKGCAREPGHRTKISVASNDQNVDPVGACVGARGSRVRMVVNELNGEKVDIIPFSDDQYEYVARALSPAKVKEVRLHEDTGTAEVIVPDFQLSLAIGKEGQNARLAHRLTGWRIDIKSETQLVEEMNAPAEDYEGEDWAQGAWIEEDGVQKWQPADGSPAMTLDEYNSLASGEDVASDAAEVPEDQIEADAASDDAESAAEEVSAEGDASEADAPVETDDAEEVVAVEEVAAEAEDAEDSIEVEDAATSVDAEESDVEVEDSSEEE